MTRTFIIAEAGVNHNGSIELAKKMIDIAFDAGADAVKFQTYKAAQLVCKNAEKASYQKNSKYSNETQFEMLQKLELSLSDHKDLIAYCKKKKIEFLSSPFDIDSIHLLDKLALKTFKIPSGEITNLPYLETLGALNASIILSTGMSDMKEIEAALNCLISSGTSKDNITVLHANTQYPTPMHDVNLRAMKSIEKTLKVKVGYSDHTLGIEVPIAAVAMGAKVIEKHFTVDKTLNGPDHKASLEPNELKAMVKSIRSIELALGVEEKKVSNSELENLITSRKSIVAKKNIQLGEFFSIDNITTKRPAKGISPMCWYDVLGKQAIKPYKKDDFIE